MAEKKLFNFTEVVQGKEIRVKTLRTVFKRYDKLSTGTGTSVAEGSLPSDCL